MTTPPPGQALTAESVSCAETPLQDLLRRVPTDAVLRWEVPEEGRAVWQLGSASSPVGLLMHRAADHLDRLASQSTAPTRGEGTGPFEARAIMLTKEHGDPNGSDYEQGQNDMGFRMVTMAREADDAITALSAPTPHEPVASGYPVTPAAMAEADRIVEERDASALADGEGLEVVAWRWRYVTDDGVTNWLIGHHVPATGIECESQPLVTAEAAAARIASAEHQWKTWARAKVAEAQQAERFQNDRATQAEARADRLAKALGDAESELVACSEYLDPLIDADGDSEGFHANREMTIKSGVDRALEQIAGVLK